MIITVTANTTIDHTVFVPYLRMNEDVVTRQAVQSIGGKPTNVSWFLHEMGASTLSLGFAAGIRGKQVESLMRGHGVITDFIEVEGESRINTVIVAEDGKAQTTITTATLSVSSEHVTEFKGRYEKALDQASCVVIGGSLPKGLEPLFYADLIRMAKAKTMPVIVDVDEPNLSVVLEAKPTFIKPNQDELSRLSGKEVRSVDDAYRIGREVLTQYGTSLVVTLGAEGALAILEDRSYFIPPLELEVSSAAGAGDGVVTGLAMGLSRNLPIEEGLRMGFAIASAGLLRPGTADLVRSDVERFLPQIQILPYAVRD